ncbi:hypothetical protein [Ciceribacter sp. L1K23]|uniref:hypothetical protein n=1 Tax=Ciceribacter sp. L1K23 TaxID=2820276 RepID=UPI0020122372|nr:hypothetical protein [Ciceribacter sp. L1K23]
MTTLRYALALLSLLCATATAHADDYAALSNTAMSITGDISFDDYEIVFENGESLAFKDLIADSFVVDGNEVPASVYSIDNPSSPVLLNDNRLCGTAPVTYLASWLDGDVTMVAVFETEEPPQSNDDMCALYTYVYP